MSYMSAENVQITRWLWKCHLLTAYSQIPPDRDKIIYEFR